ELDAADAARIAAMPVIDFVLGLVAGDADLVGVDDDDEIAGIDVRRVDGFVLAAQAKGDFTGHPAQDLVGRVDHKPLMRHFGGFGAEGFHGFCLWIKPLAGSMVGCASRVARSRPIADSPGEPGSLRRGKWRKAFKYSR